VRISSARAHRPGRWRRPRWLFGFLLTLGWRACPSASAHLSTDHFVVRWSLWHYVAATLVAVVVVLVAAMCPPAAPPASNPARAYAAQAELRLKVNAKTGFTPKRQNTANAGQNLLDGILGASFGHAFDLLQFNG
jgi:hypothetical protein